VGEGKRKKNEGKEMMGPPNQGGGGRGRRMVLGAKVAFGLI